MKGNLGNDKATLDMPDEAYTMAKNVPKQSNRRIVLVILAIVILVLVSGVVVLAVHVGARRSTDNFKEYHPTYHLDDEKSLTEIVKLTDTEGEFETDELLSIYDFSKGLTVYKFKSVDYGLEDCYVISFNMSEVPTLNTLRNMYNETNVNIEVSGDLIEEKYAVTDVWLNTAALGPRSQKACKGRNIYFFREVIGFGGREKRQTTVTTKKCYLWGAYCKTVTVTTPAQQQSLAKVEERIALLEGPFTEGPLLERV